MRIHLTGDSLIAREEGCGQPMLNALLLQARPDLRLINTAVPGHNSQDLLERLETDILGAGPADRLFILIGTNDLASHKQISLTAFRGNLQTILDQLAAAFAPEAITLISPPPVDEDKQRFRTNRRIRDYRDCLAELARSKGCGFIDLYAAFLTDGRPLPQLMTGSMDDGLHFGREGYEILSRCVLDRL